jgi:DNA-binding NarL/FixJ family response regulator
VAGLLTNREIDVLLLLEQRLTNKEIAARLMISPRTVQKHTINIYEKLQASNRREAIVQARALGLLPQVS